MKLAEALVLRANINQRIDQLHERLKRIALIQEGETPAESPQALLAELDGLLTQFGDLIAHINLTNVQTRLPSNSTLTEGLARRDVLARRHSMLTSIAETASEKLKRYSRSEIRIVPTLDVSALYHQADDIAQQRRELDAALQAANWATELIE